ncbi:formate dehydrogenase family accessory protein FdhD [Caulobacter sp. Root1455]|uniref:formate dehydrogenase accessory sulfurtransferase FdhD n=1 Tax=Caulobacter sp. Root1455 TaxID=1736465 RepID=UPI0006FE52D3|nr:formate dehydrogenase accessory sulfurtransferase FdhD [Caulobacter sp. Root1455]KQZ03679.1 formate dehydrogenase family accessory protein FdhD [Caulobacter sp. Root1455]
MSKAAAQRRSASQWRVGTGSEIIARATPQEVAVGLSFDGRPHTVLMATPDDVEDLAWGFTVTEAVAKAAEVLGIEVTETDLGILADVRLKPGAIQRKARPRTLEGRSSCGLCGVQRLADAVRPLPRLEGGERVSHQAVQRAVDALGEVQALGRLTRATHAAAFADTDGALVVVREDVGRHNALDKLAGAMARAGGDASEGFVLVTSRCSFEMVEKTVRMGCSILVAVSAPTDLAIRRAEAAGLTLVALARADGHTVFTYAERLLDAVSEPA